VLVCDGRDHPSKDFDVEVDIRSSLTVAALHEGIIFTSDLLVVSDTFYTFDTDAYYAPMRALYDPKFETMIPIYVENDSGVVVQRIGNNAFVPTFRGFLFSDTMVLGTQANPEHLCPAACESSSYPCSTPRFQFEFRFPTVGFMAAWNAAANVTAGELGFDVYSDEMYVLNDAKMDPGLIACKTTQTGSRGKLGNLQPVPQTDFLATLESSKPFKLAENYFYCYPSRAMTFFQSFGIAQGNANMFFAILVMASVLVLSAMRLLNVTVSQLEEDKTSILLAEIVKLKNDGGSLRQEHKDLLSIFAQAYRDDTSQEVAPSLSEGEVESIRKPTSTNKVPRDGHPTNKLKSSSNNRPNSSSRPTSNIKARRNSRPSNDKRESAI
jgi:hypothetical protein